MSIKQIANKFLNTVIDIERRAITRDSIGDFTESWSVIETDIKALIRPIKVDEKNGLPQGKEYTATHKVFFNVEGITNYPVNGDRVKDKNSNIYYDVVSVEKFEHPRINSSHHYELKLLIDRDIKS